MSEALTRVARTTQEKPLVSLLTLGCKLNQSETDSISTTLMKMGFSVTQKISEHAKYTVINTCTVTAKADRKSRHTIYKAIRNARTGMDLQDDVPHELSHNVHNKTQDEKAHRTKIVIVTGCFVGSGRREIENMEVDYIIDNSRKKHIPEIIESHEQGHIIDPNALQEDYFGYAPTEGVFHVRNNLKIQDGCDNFCTFCIIPFVRGTATSRPFEDILQDARTMAENGTKEIVLTGVNMSRYSYERYSFSDVLESLLTLPYEFRVRISSLEPDMIDDKFFHMLSHPRMCPHLHLCLQSGSDHILLKMRRMYDSKKYLACIARLKKSNPHMNFTTDVIVGFPGETDKDFEDTVSVITQCGFSHTHIFPYSMRSASRASRMPDQISVHTKKTRIKTLETLNIQQKNTYRLASIGQTQKVLIEKVVPSHSHTVATGLTEYYIPVEIMLPQDKDKTRAPILKNTIVPIHITGHTMIHKEAIMRAGIAP